MTTYSLPIDSNESLSAQTKQEFEKIIQITDTWLIDVVIGLNLCPFAAKPKRNEQIRICVSTATEESELLEDVLQEFLHLENAKVKELETTLVVIPNMLHDFYDYNAFIDWIDALIKQQDWQGVFQVATFHPDYCFAGCEPEDEENLTNRAAYPVLHLIREESMERAIKHFPNPEEIPDTNIARVKSLNAEERKHLFPHIFGEK